MKLMLICHLPRGQILMLIYLSDGSKYPFRDVDKDVDISHYLNGNTSLNKTKCKK